MSLTTNDIGLEGLDALTGVDALCLFVAEDDRPLPGTAGFVDWRLSGALSRVLKQKFFTGTRQDWLLVPSDGRLPITRIFVVGLGVRKRLDAGTLGQALANAAQVLGKAQVESVALEIPAGGRLDEAAQAQAFQQHFLSAFKSKRVTVLAEKGLAKLLPVRKS